MYNPFRLFSLCLALLLASLFFIPTTSFAAMDDLRPYKGEDQTQPQVKTLADGIYIGAALGYDSYRVRVSANGNFNGDTISANPAVDSTGFVGGLLGGYGAYFKNLYYLGGEAFVNGSGASVHSSFSDSVATSSYSNKVSVGTSFGVALLPGLKVNDSSLFYLRIGYSCASLEGQENATVAGVSANTDSNNWQSALAYGLGIETAIYHNFSVRGEYTHTDYNTFNSAFTTTYTPSDNQFMLGLIYHIRN